MRLSALNLRGIPLLLIFAGGFFSFGAPALPQTVKMGIAPDRFEFAASPGETISGTVEFSNGSDSPLPISLEGADFRPEGEDGKIVVGGAEDLVHSLAAWITPVRSELTVGANKKVSLDFEIHVPSGAVPGAYWGVLVIRTQGRYSLAPILLLNVRGSAPEKLTVETFAATRAVNASSVTLIARFRNEGQLYEKPQGAIFVRNVFGGNVADVPLPAANILPGYVRRVSVRVGDGLWPGPYTTTLRATYGDGQEVRATARFWVVPKGVWWGLAVIAGLCGVYWARRVLRHGTET